MEQIISQEEIERAKQISSERNERSFLMCQHLTLIGMKNGRRLDEIFPELFGIKSSKTFDPKSH